MGRKIPSGLVTMSQIFPSEITGHEKLEIPVVKNLWQAFFASRQASQNDTDRRLEYLFWRIWSSETLLYQTNLEALGRLVSRIVVEPLITRTQPQNIPSLTKVLSPLPTAVHSHSKSHPANPQQNSLQPILKKTDKAQSEPQKTTRLLLENPEGGIITCNPSTPPTPVMDETHPKDIPTGRQGTKKTAFSNMRSTRGARRRPIFNRRKSSQTSVTKSSSSGPRPESKAAEHPTTTHRNEEPAPTKPARQTIASSDTSSEGLIFPIELSPPTPSKPTDAFILTDPSYIASLRPSQQSNLHASIPAVTITEKQEEAITTEEIETVSEAPKPDTGHPDAEPKAPRSRNAQEALPEPSPDPMPEGIDVPGFPGAKRVPMPREMEEALLAILHNRDPIKGRIPLPDCACVSGQHSWLPLHPKVFLEDWMLQDESSSSPPQPSSRPLVAKGFRMRFQGYLKEAREALRIEEEEDARKALEVLAVDEMIAANEATAREEPSEFPFSKIGSSGEEEI